MYSDPKDVDQLLFWLRKTLDGDHKVLEALLKYAEREYDERKICETNDSLPAHIQGMLEKARYMCRSVWLEAHGNGPDHVLPKKEDRELLRHSGRLLNFGTSIIEDLLAHSHKQKYHSWRLRTAEKAEQICSGFIGSILDCEGPSQYRHPSGAKWLRLHARCKRRIVELWQESLRSDELRARCASTIYQIPTRIQGAHKSNQTGIGRSGSCFSLADPNALNELRFTPAGSVSEDGKWQPMYLPRGWAPETKPVDGRQRLFNHYEHHVATIVTPTDGSQPYLLVEYESRWLQEPADALQ